ncbi:MAG: VOC family protein [Candidatus Paceibacterota bacterium]|jgi:catechol-2,3-dioxygenase
MKNFLEHISLNISNSKKSFPFYKDLFIFLGYKIIRDEKDCLALRKEGTADFWIKTTKTEYLSNKFNRKNTGLNHLAFIVDSKKEVDYFYNEFLKTRNIKTLYESPKLFPEYTAEYYAVFFEDPDKIKIEIFKK